MSVQMNVDDWLDSQRINGGPHGFECIGIERMRQVWNAAREELEQQLAALNAHQIAYEAQAERELAAAQARIDELMLEYCPDEMTEEQLEEWSKHQRAVKVPK